MSLMSCLWRDTYENVGSRICIRCAWHKLTCWFGYHKILGSRCACQTVTAVKHPTAIRNAALEEAAEVAECHGAEKFEKCCDKLGACGDVIASTIRALKKEVGK